MIETETAESERPLASRRLPGGPLGLRMRTSPAIRRLIPGEIAMRAAVRGAERHWRSSSITRDQWRGAMQVIVAGTARAGEVEELSRAMAVEFAAAESLIWQPVRQALVDHGSMETLREALASGRGVIASTCHLGPFQLAMEVYTHAGTEPFLAAAPWIFNEWGPGPWGRRVARWWQCLRSANVRLVRPPGGLFAPARALLERGSLVCIAFDMPGSQRTIFLGKPVDLGSGTGRLALATDSLVLPVRSRREGARVRWRCGQALDPREHEHAESLHNTLASIHERWILEEPYALEDPRREGAWEENARPEAWTRPVRA